MAAAAQLTSAVRIAQAKGSNNISGSIRPGLKSACSQWAKKTVSNGTIRTSAMLVWNPFEMKKYETFSYLPALTDQEIARQVDYITRNGWVPCLEFADVADAYVNSENCVRMGSVTANYFDNRYWTMWKLPMFGCSDPGQVITEVANCRKAFPGAYSRLVAFDPIRQVQIASFVVNHPELKGKKGSYGAEVSNGFSGTAGSSSSSSSWDTGSKTSSWDTGASSWDTGSKTNDWGSSGGSSWDTGAKKDDWSYDWNKGSETSSWDSGAKKDDWSYDWSKSSEPASTSSWDTGSKTNSWDTGSSSWDTGSKTNDWSYDWNKSDTSTNSWDTGSKTNDWGSSGGSSWDTGAKKEDYSYDWSKRDDTSSTTSSWDTGKKEDYSYDWSKRDDTSNSWSSSTSYSTSSNGTGSGGYERKALVKEVIEVAKTVRDLEIKYAEVDVAGTKRLHADRKAELDKLLADKDRWDKTEKYHIKQQMQECQQQITDLQRKISEVQSMMQSRDAKFAVQIAACQKDLATAEAAMAKVKELERQFNEKEAKLDDLTSRICK